MRGGFVMGVGRGQTGKVFMSPSLVAITLTLSQLMTLSPPQLFVWEIKDGGRWNRMLGLNDTEIFIVFA